MAYCTTNFQSKKALKESIAAGQKPRAFNPGLGPDLSNFTGNVALEGPHYPQPHKWYAAAKLEAGVIVSVK